MKVQNERDLGNGGLKKFFFFAKVKIAPSKLHRQHWEQVGGINSMQSKNIFSNLIFSISAFTQLIYYNYYFLNTRFNL